MKSLNFDLARLKFMKTYGQSTLGQDQVVQQSQLDNGKLLGGIWECR